LQFIASTSTNNFLNKTHISQEYLYFFFFLFYLAVITTNEKNLQRDKIHKKGNQTSSGSGLFSTDTGTVPEVLLVGSGAASPPAAAVALLSELRLPATLA
jgi:hypothetical protein